MTRAAGVLVRLPNWVGDAVMATCVLRAVRRGRPGAWVCAAGRPRLADLLAGSPHVDEFITLPRDALRSSWRLGAAWRGRFETALVLPTSFRAVLFPWHARATVRVGYRGQCRGWFLTEALAVPQGPARRRIPEPMPVYWRRIVEAAGIPWDGDAPELAVTTFEREAAEAYGRAAGIADGERFVGLSPGAAFGPSKLWPAERFAEAAARLHAALGLRAIVFLAPGEEPLAAEIMRSASSPVVSTAQAPLSLSLLKPFIERCAVLVTTDSGTRHVAVALNVPVVTVMGPTDPRYTDYCLSRQAIVRRDVSCGPCHLKVCPRDHRCMRDLTAEEVADRALALVAARGA